jgi:hypothetical protein
MEMGFNREEVLSALRLSRNDYELACEYLLSSEARVDSNMLNYPS